MPLLFRLGQHSALSAVVEVCWREKDCSHIWTTSTWSANQTGREQSTTSFVSICGTNAESPHTQARPRCGTKVAPVQIAPDCSARQRTSLLRLCGEETPICTLINRDSRCLEFLSDTYKRFLEEKIADHSVLFDQIPAIPDPQSAWLLLSFCVAEDGRIRSSPRPWCLAVFVQDSVHSSMLRCRRSGQIATMGRRPWTPELPNERNPPHIG